MNTKHISAKSIKLIFVCFSLFTLIFNQYFNILLFSVSYFVLLLYLLFRYSFLDFRVGFVLLLFVYSFYSSLRFYLQDIELTLPVADTFINNISHVTQEKSFILNHCFILGVILNIFYEKNYFLSSSKNLRFCKVNYFYTIIILICFILILSFLKLDWKRIQNEYTLEGINNTFFLSYFLFAYLFYSQMNKSFSKIVLLLILSCLLLYMGVRQVVFWGILMFVLHKNFYFHKKLLINVLNIKFMFVSVFILAIFTLAVYYRVNRDQSFGFLFDINYFYLFKLSLNLFYSETIYTYCNLYQVYDHIGSYDYSIINFFVDFILQLIPHAIFPDKYHYLQYRLVNPDNLLNPFGAWYYVGSITLITKHPIFVFIISFIICFLFNNIFRLKQIKMLSSNIRYSLYFVIYVFCFLYNVRSPVIGGFKIAFTIITILIFVDFLTNLKCKKS